ncbi:MAG: VWA domain-containing protein [Proteobacteria bacterium]|nr:VWA domain-containing protein [Pseudomonadota bacterium]
MLTQKYGIKVICQGVDCKTDGKTIYLPALPEHIDNQALLGMVRGFLDHEAGHIVGKTNMDTFRKAVETHGTPGRNLLNAVEDVRIEQIMANIWAGCEINLRTALSEVSKLIEAKAHDDTPVEGTAMRVKDCIRHPLKQLTLCLYYAGKGHPIPSWVDQKYIDKVDEANRKFNLSEVGDWATCTDDLLPMIDWLMEEYNYLKADQQQQPAQSKIRVKVKKGGSGGGGLSQSDAQSINNADEIEVEIDDDATATDGGDEPACQGNDGSPPVGLDSDDSTGGHGEDKTQDQIDAEEKLAMAVAGAGAGDSMAQAIGDELGKTAQANPHESARPYDGSLDRYITTRPAGPASTSDFAHQAKLAGGTMRQKLSQLLQSEGRVWWRGGRSRGLPDPKSIARLATGIGSDVLRMRYEHKAPNTACYMMIDGSGSMGSRQMLNACLSAAAFGGVMDLCGHASAISAFVGDSVHPDVDEMDPDQAGRINAAGIRMWGVTYADIKRFGQPYRNCLAKLARMTYSTGGSTPLGESIIFAAKELLARQEKRKVLLAFTDGEPNNTKYCKWACRHCESKGIEVVLIGINSTAVRTLHHRHAVCNDINELSTSTMIELTKALRPKG